MWQLEQASYQEIYELCKNTLFDDFMMLWQKKRREESRLAKTYIMGGILLCTILLRALPDLSKEKPLKHIMKMILCLHPYDIVGWSVGKCLDTNPDPTFGC